MANTSDKPEVSLINAICEDKEIARALNSGIDDLFGDVYRPVWEWIKSYYASWKTVPSVEVLQGEFPEFEKLKSFGTVGHHINQLQEKYTERKVKELIIKASKAMGDTPSISIAQKMLTELTKINRAAATSRDLDITDIDDALVHYEQVKIKSDEMGGMPGISTGFQSIDSAYPTGMAPGHLIVVIGWPARAKTWVTSKIAVNAWKNGFKPMIVSMEMSPEGMRDRIYGMIGEGEFSVSAFSRGDIVLDDLNSSFRPKFKDKHGFVLVSQDGVMEMTPNMIQSKIDQHQPDLVFLDYHQLFTDNDRSTGATERNMNIGRQFKGLARSNNIPIIDITAATAKPGADLSNPPLLSDVAWSKSIEYDADLAVSIHRQNDSNIIQVDGVKNRWGPMFNFFIDADLDKGIWEEKFSL